MTVCPQELDHFIHFGALLNDREDSGWDKNKARNEFTLGWLLVCATPIFFHLVMTATLVLGVYLFLRNTTEGRSNTYRELGKWNCDKPGSTTGLVPSIDHVVIAS